MGTQSLLQCCGISPLPGSPVPQVVRSATHSGDAFNASCPISAAMNETGYDEDFVSLPVSERHSLAVVAREVANQALSVLDSAAGRDPVRISAAEGPGRRWSPSICPRS